MMRQFVSLRNFTACACRPLAVQKRWRSVAAAAPAAPKFGDLSDDQKRQVDVYLDTLLDWNTRMNLTGGDPAQSLHRIPVPPELKITPTYSPDHHEKST